ncbi:hypothetical protein FRACYDRAFT_197363 [Fragilariopsis cylindrus CCMP1102]|uniref:Uncharacterized protein n=1 Tax=Fragilariopsis cylindrus CCMP1102 TaxID=635003 RepID=A0A1E7EQG3_9STRA|nr:hypothetical protein FRACYDRAFT_197363 [Fragilariopsis cylindrus CCMP1102]|eukprot:OEU07783.1 hypothetical protein FRACYDRAFT_197363 [Fragilariopsis cylindrus CCMP1102]
MYCWWNVDLEIIATGQSSTKAAKFVHGRNAIEFNSIQLPSMNRLIPNGYDRLKLNVLLAVCSTSIERFIRSTITSSKSISV